MLRGRISGHPSRQPCIPNAQASRLATHLSQRSRLEADPQWLGNIRKTQANPLFFLTDKNKQINTDRRNETQTAADNPKPVSRSKGCASSAVGRSVGLARAFEWKAQAALERRATVVALAVAAILHNVIMVSGGAALAEGNEP